MKILITGGAGFIGSHLTDYLLTLDHQVIVIDNYTTGRRENLPDLFPHNLASFLVDIADKPTFDKVFDSFKPDVVIHAAASYNDPDAWIRDVATNILGTINVVEACKRTKVKRLIYFQTSLCYGLNPIEQPITLNHPLFSGKYSGGSSYAISKTAAEQYIELSGLDFVSFRLANMYGPRNLSGAIPTFYKKIKNNEECVVMNARRDFVFISDLILVVKEAINMGGASGYYHVSTGRDYSIKDIYKIMFMLINPNSNDFNITVREPGEDDTKTILIDPSKTKAMFGWDPHIVIREGLKRAIEWYDNNSFDETYTHLKI